MVCLRVSSALMLIATCFLLKEATCSLVIQGHDREECEECEEREEREQRAITCEGSGNVHVLKCESGVIIVWNSLYGRTDPTICSEGRPAAQLSNTQCSQPGVLNTLKASCNGKKKCEVSLTGFTTPDPCSGTFKYLETNYSCVEVKTFQALACEDSLANLYCGCGKVIVVYKAIYGRQDKTTCIIGRPSPQVQNDQCNGMVTATVANKCNGRTSCLIRASNANFGDPCSGTYKYLRIIYNCEYPSKEHRATTCDTNGNVHHLKCESGIININAGLYGRTDPTICSEGRPAAQLSNTMCSQAGAVDVLKTSCNGKESCEVRVDAFHTSDPCSGTFKYVDTNFTCLPNNFFHALACEDSFARLCCAEGLVIVVSSAIYGRLDKTTCILGRPSSQIQNDNCQSDKTSVVASSCNGKNSCDIRVTNTAFGEPCSGTYKYLKVIYWCEYPFLSQDCW